MPSFYVATVNGTKISSTLVHVDAHDKNARTITFHSDHPSIKPKVKITVKKDLKAGKPEIKDLSDGQELTLDSYVGPLKFKYV